MEEIGKILVKKNKIKEEHFDKALRYKHEHNITIGESLVRLGYIKESELSLHLIEQLTTRLDKKRNLLNLSELFDFLKYSKPALIHKKKIYLYLIFSALFSITLPIFVSFIMNYLIDGNNFIYLLYFSLFAMGFFVVKVVFEHKFRYVLNLASCNVAKYLRDKLYNNLMNIPFLNLKKYKHGDLSVALLSNLDDLRLMIFNYYSLFLYSLFTISINIICLFIINQLLFFISFFISILIFIIPLLFALKMSKVYHNMNKIFGEFSDFINSNIKSINIIKSFNKETKLYKYYKMLLNKFNKNDLNLWRLSALSNNILSFFICLIYLIILWIGGLLVFQNKLNFGTLLSLYFFVNTIISYISTLSNFFIFELQQVDAAWKNVKKYLQYDYSYHDRKKPWFEEDKATNGDVVLRNINFKYDVDKPFINDLNIEIKKNESVAFVGESGSGKSSILRLVSGMIKPEGGQIFLNNTDIDFIPQKQFYSNIGILTQFPHIFNLTIKENIILGKEFNEQLLIKVSKKANIYNKIDSLKEKFDTLVGESGEKLSIGEMQRIAFARLLYKDPNIFLLDEPTSSVDPLTEKLLLKSIKESVGIKTIIMVTHHFDLIENFNKIYFFENGSVVESGTHSQLIKNKKAYYKLYRQRRSSK